MPESEPKEIKIKDIPIFQGLAQTDLEKIQGITFERTFKEGDFLFRQGDIGDAFFIIKKGAIDILKDDKVIVNLGQGEFFGEMALIEGAPRSAGARASTESQMLVVKKSDFELLLRLNSFVALKIMSELGSRLHGRAESSTKSEHDGRLITFFSPKGGCGKTLGAIQLAEAFTRRRKGCKVLLLDLDLQFGDVGAVLKIPEKYSVRNLLGEDGENIDLGRVDEVIYSHRPGNFDVICAPNKPEDSELIHSKHIKQLLPVLRERYDFILVDTHCLFEDLTINLLDMSDLVFIFFLPVLLHVKNLGTCLRVMNNLEFNMDKFHLLISRFNYGEYHKEQILNHTQIEGYIKSSCKLDLQVKMRLSDDPEIIHKSLLNNQTIFQTGEKFKLDSPLIKDFDLLADCFVKDNCESNFS